jgi:geranylgeranyl diphosphate synthase, type II
VTTTTNAAAPSAPSAINKALERWRDLVLKKLLEYLPLGSPIDLYGLLPSYPIRGGKGLRPVLCLTTCAALGGDPDRALSSAIAIELFHNAFLIHDDIQDQSELRRGRPAMAAEHGVAIALNVGNAMNLIGMQRLMEERWTLGSDLAWRLMQETELMMRHSLEGQATELRWIKENVCDLEPNDYYRMCLKKTSWYTCIYPCRLGALIARQGDIATEHIDRYGWYLGAAFQIQDDILNLTGDPTVYGKEICGDLWEGKRTLMVIYLLDKLKGNERSRLIDFLGQERQERCSEDVAWVLQRMVDIGCIEHAQEDARQLSAAARREAQVVFQESPHSDELDFLLALPSYVIARDR